MKQTPIERLFDTLEKYEDDAMQDVQSVIYKGLHHRQFRLLVRGKALAYVQRYHPKWREEQKDYHSDFKQFILPKEYGVVISCGK